MNETDEKFNIENKNKKPRIFYFVIAILAVFVVATVVFVLDTGDSALAPTSSSSSSVDFKINKKRASTQLIDKEKVREELSKPSNFTLTEKDKQKIREELAKPRSFNLTKEDKQAIRKSLAQ